MPKQEEKTISFLGQNQLFEQRIITNMRTLGRWITHLNPGSREFMLFFFKKKTNLL